MTAGVAVVGARAESVREAVNGGTWPGPYVLGLVLILVPAAVGIAAPRPRAATPVALAAAAAVLMQIVFVLAGRVPATAGSSTALDLVTRAVRDLSGVPEEAITTAVLTASNVLLAATFLLLVAHVTRSARIGALAVVAYAATLSLPVGPEYASMPLALALAVLAAYLVVTRQRGFSGSIAAAVFALVAVGLTDVATTVVVLMGLVGWLVLEVVLRRQRSNSVLPLAVLVGTALVVTAVALTRPATLPRLTALDVRADSPVPWVTWQGAPEWASWAAGGAAVVVLLVLGLGLWRSRFFVPLRVSLAVLLAVAATLELLVLLGHLTSVMAGFAGWAPPFVSLAFAFVGSWWFFQWRPQWWRAVLLGAGVAVVLLGTVVGYAGAG
jgi:hypothetical protein